MTAQGQGRQAEKRRSIRQFAAALPLLVAFNQSWKEPRPRRDLPSLHVVTDPDWVHLDLSAGNRKGGLAHIPSDITGFGVRFTLNLLLDRKILR